MTYEKPIPLKTIDNHPYWDAADRHEFTLQKCEDCNTYAHPPGPACAKCGSENVYWESLGNEVTAKIYSYIISYRPFLPGFQNDLPTIIAQAQLDQVPDVKIMCNVLQCDEKEVHIGMPVQMIWQGITDDRALPQWAPIKNE